MLLKEIISMNPKLTATAKQDIMTKLAELSSAVEATSTESDMRKEASTLTEKERLVNSILNDPTGRSLKRLAYAMTEPLRVRLDYVGIGRKLIQTDLLPQGVIPRYDRDFPEVPAVKISARGNPPTVTGWSDFEEVNTFEIATLRAIKYAEISIRRFNALDRTKNKAAFELKIAEDDVIFSAINTAATTSSLNTNVSTNVTRAALAQSFSDIEGNRLAVGNLLMHPRAFKGIRGTWNNTDLDQVNMQGLLETGWFASIWSAKIWVSDRLNQISNGTNKIYVMALKEQLGRFPIRYDVEIKPFDYPPERVVMFSVYENVGVLVHNTNGVATTTIV
jgi:hypothetical protein